MESSEQRAVDFEGADLAYADLKCRHEAGEVNTDHFEARLKELMVKDGEGRWWA